jgi:hypothetical protein
LFIFLIELILELCFETKKKNIRIKIGSLNLLGEELLRIRIQLESGQNGQVGIRAKQEE